MSIREFIGVIKGNLNNSSPDISLSGEHIYWIGINIAKLFIKRETDSRKLFKNSSLFKTINCFELKEVNAAQCGINIPCNTIMKSVKKLPELYLSNFGSLIQVFNLTNDVDYKEVSITKYKNLKNQKFKPLNTKYFWIEDGYLYIPDSNVKMVKINGIFSDIEAFNELNSVNTCGSILDTELQIPDYMLTSIIEATTKQVSYALSIPKDEDTNLNSNDRN